MADFNSSLPVVGSQHVTQSTSPWVISGTVSTNILTSPVPVSGNALGVSGTAFQQVWVGVGSIVQSGTSQPVFRGIGSVRIAEVGLSIPISGIVNQGTNPWVISGTATVSGTITVGNTVSVTAGARENIINDYTSGVGVIAGGSMVHTYLTTGSLYVSRIVTGFSGKGKSIVAISGPGMLHKAVGFNSTAFPNIQLDFGEENGIYVEGSGISVISFNRESTEAQDIYSTIIGYEVI